MNAAGQTVGMVARRLGVSVRTLHHWDQLGIVRPSQRTLSGYRTYDERELARLRRVLSLRELGVPLARIPTLLDGAGTDRRAELEQRRAELAAKIDQLQQVAREVDSMLAADLQGVLLDDADAAAVLGADWDPAWSQRARERWGDSAQWAEYAERSSRRTPVEWRELSTSMLKVVADMAAAKLSGVVPGDAAADSLAEAHRQAMSEFFHCTLSMHVLIGRLGTTEPGYGEYYDGLAPGLAAWMSEVIDAAARRAGLDPDSARWE